MRQSIFALAHEDDTALDNVVAETPITPEEVIEDQADHDEFAETAAAAQTDIAAIEESDEIAEEATDVAEDIEEKLEKPEEVTADDVMVAQESMRIICHRYGVDPEAVVGSRLSHESASANPIHALKLSQESASDFVKKIIDGIRNIFKRLIVTIKKLFAKAVVLLSRNEKVATKLAAVVAAAGEAPADAKFDDAEVAGIAARLGAVIVAEGGKLGKDPVAGLGEYIAILQDAKHIATYTTVLKDAAAGQMGVLKASAETAEEAGKKAAEELSKKLGGTTTAAVLKKVGSAAGDANKFLSPVKGEVVPFAVTGTKVRAFAFGEGGRLTSVTLTVAPAALKGITVDVPSKASIVKLLEAVVATAKKSKDYEAAATKEVDEADKILADLTKEVMKGELTPAAKRSVTNYSSAVRVVTANLAVDSILAQVSGTKAILGYCSMAAKKLAKA